MEKTVGRKHRMLLLIDAGINLALGILLLLFPIGMAAFFGVPEAETNFYPSLLGAVLFGIGIALLVDLYGTKHNIRGLGLGGAIVINFIAAVVLLLWLVLVPLGIPLRGLLLLWLIALFVLIIGFAEVLSKSWKY